MKKLVVSVGAGVTQTPFIKKLKEKGYLVASFGKGRNDVEAIENSDFFKEIDTSDSNTAIEWLESLNIDICAAGSYAGGVAIDTLQKIDRHFNLATKIPVKLSVGMDKYEQQKLYDKLNLNPIKSYLVKEILNKPSLINSYNKYILKPVIGRGSEGVFKYNGKHLLDALNKNKISNGIVQDFVVGKEYRLLFIIQNKKQKFLACIERQSYKDTFLLGRLSINSEHTSNLKKYVQQIIDNTGLNSCIVKADVIIDNDKINLIEMDIGVGGGVYYKEYINSGFSYRIEDEYINLILDKEVSNKYSENLNCVMDYVFNETGKVFKFNNNGVKSALDNHLSEYKIIKNKLNPEKKGTYSSNADFIFTTIHNKKSDIAPNSISTLVNNNNFYL